MPPQLINAADVPDTWIKAWYSLGASASDDLDDDQWARYMIAGMYPLVSLRAVTDIRRRVESVAREFDPDWYDDALVVEHPQAIAAQIRASVDCD